MSKDLGRMLVQAGAVVYVAILFLQFLDFVSFVGLAFIPTLGILAQIALCIPVLAHLYRKFEIPLLDYTKCLALLVSVLAVSGYLGLPLNARMGDFTTYPYDKHLLGIQEDLGEYEKLQYQVDLAAAESEEEQKKIRESIQKVDERITEEDRKQLRREAETTQAERQLATWDRSLQSTEFAGALLRNGLIVIAAFVMLAGAYMLQHQGRTPALPAKPQDPGPSDPPQSASHVEPARELEEEEEEETEKKKSTRKKSAKKPS